MKYMRENIPDEYGIKQLQDKILEIMLEVDDICKKNNIQYCLMGGSAIGAMRHHGFIPWDDDMDIFMTAENYEKLKRLFINKRLGDLYLQEWGAHDGMVTMAKIRADGTTYIEEILKDWDIHQGIYIDIMVLHGCPNNLVLQFIQYLSARYIVAKGLADRHYSRRHGLAAVLLNVLASLPKGFGLNTSLKNVYHYDKKNTRYYCNFLGKSSFKKSIYRKEIIDNAKRVDFETVDLPVPGRVEEYLTQRFGDYMRIPTKERIAWEQHAEHFETDVDFRLFLNKPSMSFLDESRLI